MHTISHGAVSTAINFDADLTPADIQTLANVGAVAAFFARLDDINARTVNENSRRGGNRRRGASADNRPLPRWQLIQAMRKRAPAAGAPARLGERTTFKALVPVVGLRV